MSPEPIPGARLLFTLDAAVAHLNHGSFGAVPTPVQRAQQRLRDELDANPLRFFAGGLYDRLAHVRRHLAAFVGADPDGSALVPNATTGVAVVLNSLRLAAGDEVVTTDHGYGAVTLAVQRACRESGARQRVVELPLDLDDDRVVAAVTGALTGRTRLLVVDHVASSTARVLPAARIAAAARAAGVPVLVDAAHAPGNLAAVEADFWVGNFHKWAYAPRGTALLVVAPGWRERIRPLVVSWQEPQGFPWSVEWQGTQDYTPWLAAPIGLFTLRSLGLDAVRAHNAALAAYGQRVVGAALGLDAGELPGHGGERPMPMRVLPLPAGHAADLAGAVALQQRIADRLGTEVGIRSWRGRGLLRLSAQVYNRADEYDRLAAGLPALLREG